MLMTDSSVVSMTAFTAPVHIDAELMRLQVHIGPGGQSRGDRRNDDGLRR